MSDPLGKTEMPGENDQWPTSSESSREKAQAACEGATEGPMQGMWLVILYLDHLLRPLRTLTLCFMEALGSC